MNFVTQESRGTNFNWKDAKYPMLGVNRDRDIVLFISHGEGVLLSNEACHNDMWDMDYFIPYDNPIVLSNDKPYEDELPFK